MFWHDSVTISWHQKWDDSTPSFGEEWILFLFHIFHSVWEEVCVIWESQDNFSPLKSVISMQVHEWKSSGQIWTGFANCWKKHGKKRCWQIRSGGLSWTSFFTATNADCQSCCSVAGDFPRCTCGTKLFKLKMDYEHGFQIMCRLAAPILDGNASSSF